MAEDTAPVVLSAVPTGAGQVIVTVGVDVTATTTVTMPAWAFHALGTTEVAQAVTETYRRTVRLLQRRPT